jgi:hypothetical protein
VLQRHQKTTKPFSFLPVLQFTLLGADPYHKLCYKELHHPKCDVCLQFVRLSPNPLNKLIRASANIIALALPFKWLPLQSNLFNLRVLQIPTNRSGLIEYRAHPFWGQKYCPLHEHDRTPRCCSCEKMEVYVIDEIAYEISRFLYFPLNYLVNPYDKTVRSFVMLCLSDSNAFSHK